MNNLRTLPETLRGALDEHPDGPLCVAFSGGPDSVALLHALASLPQARARGLRALHIDHGLHVHSADWARQVHAFCAHLSLPCEVIRVHVSGSAGEGIEAAARQARYSAFEDSLQAGEWLLLGHHREDQAETVLLKLLRGAGPEGLGGMRAIRQLGPGTLWRPLLATPRAWLRDYAQAHALPCIDDPSNADTRLGRNHLRHEILPRLARHWPQAIDSIVHSAALCRAADDSLRARWLAAFATLHDPATGSLDAHGWLALDDALRGPLLDHWLHARRLPAPTTAQRRQVERQCSARAGQQPRVRWPGAELHIWKGRLWSQAPRVPVDPAWQVDWHGEPLTLPDGSELVLTPTTRLDVPLGVHLRRGGERIKPSGDRHTRELRDLFQQVALPPWRRESCPLIYAADELIAVADLWRTTRGEALFDALGASVQWIPARSALSPQGSAGTPASP